MPLETYNNKRQTRQGGVVTILDDGSHVSEEVLGIVINGPDYAISKGGELYVPRRLRILDTYRSPNLEGRLTRYYVLRDCSHVTKHVLAKLWGCKNAGIVQSRINSIGLDDDRIYHYGKVPYKPKAKSGRDFGNAAWQALSDERRA